jgi:hypothetical protein
MTERETLETSDLAGRTKQTEDEPLSRDRRDDADGDEGRDDAPLISRDRGEAIESRWDEVQAGFVDEPREAVRQADQLVAELMQQLAADFAETRSQLESQWDSGEDASTEDLRVALTRYRSFFRRLLSA